MHINVLLEEVVLILVEVTVDVVGQGLEAQIADLTSDGQGAPPP